MKLKLRFSLTSRNYNLAIQMFMMIMVYIVFLYQISMDLSSHDTNVTYIVIIIILIVWDSYLYVHLYLNWILMLVIKKLTEVIELWNELSKEISDIWRMFWNTYWTIRIVKGIILFDVVAVLILIILDGKFKEAIIWTEPSILYATTISALYVPLSLYNLAVFTNKNRQTNVNNYLKVNYIRSIISMMIIFYFLWHFRVENTSKAWFVVSIITYTILVVLICKEGFKLIFKSTKRQKSIMLLNNFNLEDLSGYNIFYKYSDFDSKAQKFRQGEYNTIVFSSNDTITNYTLYGSGLYDASKDSILLIKEEEYFPSQSIKVKTKRRKETREKTKDKYEHIVYYIRILRKYQYQEIFYSETKWYLRCWKINKKQTIEPKNEDIVNRLVQKHYYTSESGSNILSKINSYERQVVERKTLLIEGGQGTGKTTFFKSRIYPQTMNKPIFISIWNEGPSKDPLSVISNALMKDLDIFETIRILVFRRSFSIFHAIALISGLVMSFKFITANFTDSIHYGKIINGIIAGDLLIVFCIIGFVGLLVCLILNYIELTLLLFKTGSTTNDRTKYLEFIKKAINKRLLVIEDFERIDDFSKISRWVAEIDALNEIIHLSGVRIILTYDKKELFNISGKFSLLEPTTRKRLLMTDELQFTPDLEKYKQELSILTGVSFVSCEDYRQVYDLKRKIINTY